MANVETTVLKIDPLHPDAATIDAAAKVINSGGLVAFPTETVYGLGANGLDSVAIARIYAAKGRPARNPIILHVGSIAAAKKLVAKWPDTAQLLAERFWPGPLTMVLPKSSIVPDIVSAHGPTVAIRWPLHPVAQALIAAAGVPIAAPSANRSSELSPTLAEHVMSGLKGRFELLLDGGPTAAGIESTVIDLSGTKPRLLRPGPIPPDAIEALLGPLERDVSINSESPLPAPGMLARHYAPRTPLESFPNLQKLLERQATLVKAGEQIGILHFGEFPIEVTETILIAMPPDPETYGAELYRLLHDLDDRGLDRLLVELPPKTDSWLAIRDRLLRASSTLKKG